MNVLTHLSPGPFAALAPLDALGTSSRRCPAPRSVPATCWNERTKWYNPHVPADAAATCRLLSTLVARPRLAV